MDTSNVVVIPTAKYAVMVENCNFLLALQMAGVDNWEGVDEAKRIYTELMCEEGTIQ